MTEKHQNMIHTSTSHWRHGKKWVQVWKAPQGLPRPNYNEPKLLLSPLTLVENAQDGSASPHWWIHMVLPNSTMDGLTSLSGNAAFSLHYGRWPDPCPTHNSLLHLLPCEFFLNFLNFLKITDFYAHFSFVRWITATIMITFIECLLFRRDWWVL